MRQPAPSAAGRIRTRSAALACLAVTLLALAGSARAETSVRWPGFLPAAPVPATEYDLGPLNSLCPMSLGLDTLDCVDDTLLKLSARYAESRATCDHRGIFLLAYIRTNQDFRAALHRPGEFFQVSRASHGDTMFGQLYFDADDNWQSGRHERVPRAWQIAMEAAADKSVTGLGNLMLGASSHLNRDLPYAVAASGLVDRETGGSQKPDFETFGDVLVRSLGPIMRELEAEWDPDIVVMPEGQVELAILITQTWRESIWRFAERLVSARSEVELSLAEAEIEANAAEQNEMIRRMFTYPPGESSAARDAFCMSRR